MPFKTCKAVSNVSLSRHKFTDPSLYLCCNHRLKLLVYFSVTNGTCSRQGYKMSWMLEICVVSGLENNFSTLREYLRFSL